MGVCYGGGDRMTKCAYCHEEIRNDPYQGTESEKFEVNICGADCTVALHNDCVDRLIGEFLSRRRVLE